LEITMSKYVLTTPAPAGSICRHPAPLRVCTSSGVICTRCGARVPALPAWPAGGKFE